MALQDLQITVDFENGDLQKSLMSGLTPSTYSVKICRLVLWNPNTDERFELFGHDDPNACPVFEFTRGAVVVDDLLAESAEPPEEPGFGVVEMDILYLQMDLDFLIEASSGSETRTLRLYMSQGGEYMPGDLVIVGSEGSRWGFGTGNMTGDANLEGLPRDQAYTLETWPRGHSTDEWGPFGNAAFWADHPPNPFTWAIAIPPEVEETAVIVFKVAETWEFTDQNEDGIYDWPSDFGNDWSMAYPMIDATAPEEVGE